MEAGTGIEPVFTDLQSSYFPCNYKVLGQKRFQDKSGTARERETRPGPIITLHFGVAA